MPSGRRNGDWKLVFPHPAGVLCKGFIKPFGLTRTSLPAITYGPMGFEISSSEKS
jgi:hypothetical protein